jgi:putative ABC transport system permease protein
MGADLGFRPENVLLLESNIGDSYYNTNAKRLGYYRPLMQKLAEVPGVASVGGLRYFPMHARLVANAIQIKEKPAAANQQPIAYYNRVAGDYFDAMRIPLVAGRLPSSREMWEPNDHVLINAAAARAYFPKGDAVGKHIDGKEIIGVVGNVRQAGLAHLPGPEVYYTMGADESTGILTIAIRTERSPDAAVMQSIAAAARQYDNSQTRPSVIPLTTFLGETVSARRAAARVGSVFALLSLVLAALGIYGLVSYWVTQRAAEFGIRMALGATGASVVRLVVGHCLRLTGIGIVLGLGASFILSRIISSFLYGIPSLDPVTFAAAPAALLIIAVFAASRPAFRATRINALDALRSE